MRPPYAAMVFQAGPDSYNTPTLIGFLFRLHHHLRGLRPGLGPPRCPGRIRVGPGVHVVGLTVREPA